MRQKIQFRGKANIWVDLTSKHNGQVFSFETRKSALERIVEEVKLDLEEPKNYLEYRIVDIPRKITEG